MDPIAFYFAGDCFVIISPLGSETTLQWMYPTSRRRLLSRHPGLRELTGEQVKRINAIALSFSKRKDTPTWGDLEDAHNRCTAEVVAIAQET